jgi:hypothetical protein
MGSVRLPSPVVHPCVLSIALLFFPALDGSAQESAQNTTAPAHLAFVDGSATLEREGQSEAADSGMPLVAGDRLRTTLGRVEVLFPDGTALEVDEFASIELQAPTLLRLTAGRVLLIVAGVNDPANAIRYQIDTPEASALTDGPGEYRVALLTRPSAAETELAVFRGYATLSSDAGSTNLRAGERALARDLLAPSQPMPFNSARFDAFDRWAAARRDARLGTASVRYLPRDLYSYSGTFDRYGSWVYEAPYGYVWYPAVAAGWRPYHEGYWRSLPAYGWTWVGHDAWGWPTHHYGRWGHARSRWFWIPGFQWGPAWVSWASAPGYVGWCPLGFDGRPVFALTYAGGSPWAGWVVVSRPYFGNRFAVRRHALGPGAIPARTPFIVHNRPPQAVGLAVARPRAIPRPVTGSSAPPAGRAVTRTPNTGASGQPATAASPAAAATRSARAPESRTGAAPANQPPIAQPPYTLPTRPMTRERMPGQTPAASSPPQSVPSAQSPRQGWPPGSTPQPAPPSRSETVQPRMPPAGPAQPVMAPRQNAPAPRIQAPPPSGARTAAPSSVAQPGPAPAPRPAAPPPAPRAAPPPSAPSQAAPPPAAPRQAAPPQAAPRQSATPRSAPPPQSAPAQPAPPAPAPAAAPPAGARSPRGR